MGTLAENVTIDFSIKFDDELVKPKSPVYSWSPTNNSSSVKVLADSRIIAASATAATVVLPTHADALFHIIEDTNRSGSLTVFLNGDANGNTLAPWRVLSEAITAMTVTNSDTVNVQYLTVYTVIPQGTVFERSGSVTLPTDTTKFLGLTDTPSSFASVGLQVLRVNTGETAVEFIDQILLENTQTFATVTTGTTTLGTTYSLILCDATSGNVTIALPAVASSANSLYKLKRIDTSGSYSVTLNPDGAETIDGAVDYNMAHYESNEIFCDGSTWYIL